MKMLALYENVGTLLKYWCSMKMLGLENVDA
jgi:hypothetical protein